MPPQNLDPQQSTKSNSAKLKTKNFLSLNNLIITELFILSKVAITFIIIFSYCRLHSGFNSTVNDLIKIRHIAEAQQYMPKIE
ncbi:MAG: hypothetical protein U9O66_01855 [Patescibacteria group bacterium]|nr:hypothetical protein [Patescibacteria group bacterium]